MKRALRTLLALLLALALLPTAPAHAEGDGSVDGAELQRRLEEYIEKNNLDPQHVSVGYVYTETGETWLYNEAEWYYSASCYKVPVMMLLAELEHEGVLTRDSKVSGLELGYAEESILVHSNNDYAHMMMRYFGTEPECREQYQKYSDMPKEDYISDFYDYSYYNVRFLTDVFKTLYADPERFPNIIDCLKRAQPDNYIHGRLGWKYEVAQKYGSYQEWDGDYYNNTAAIVYMPHPVIMVVMTLGLDSSPGERVIQDISELLEQYTLELDAERETLAAQEAERLAREEEERRLAAEQAEQAQQQEPQAPAPAVETTPQPTAEPAIPAQRRGVSPLLWVLGGLLLAALILIPALLARRKAREAEYRAAMRRKARQDAEQAEKPQKKDGYAPRH